MKVNVTKKDPIINIAFTGMLAAVVLVGYYLSIKFPLMGAKAQIGFGNVFGILSGLLLGPVYGGFSAGIGGAIYDLTSGWADTALLTLVTKFIMGFVAGMIAWWGKEIRMPSLKRVITAAIIGSVTYSLLYLGNGYIEAVLMGNAQEAIQYIMGVKVAVTFVNAIIADVIAVPLFMAIRKPLASAKILYSN